MSINVGLTSEKPFRSIVGFSGKIIDVDNLKYRKKNSTNTLLIHGDKDDIVSPTHLLEAKDFFLRENINVETHLIKNCGHHIPVEASSIALNYILKKNLVV
jgi:phospholipase/carboxylesterase